MEALRKALESVISKQKKVTFSMTASMTMGKMNFRGLAPTMTTEVSKARRKSDGALGFSPVKRRLVEKTNSSARASTKCVIENVSGQSVLLEKLPNCQKEYPRMSTPSSVSKNKHSREKMRLTWFEAEFQ